MTGSSAGGRVRIAGSVVAIAALLLTGCASEPKPTPTPTASETPTPTPTPTPTVAAPDPADVSTWVISASGIGPVVRGAVYPDVATPLTTFALAPVDAACPRLHTMSREGTATVLLITSEAGDQVEEVWLSGDPGAEAPRTAEGIGPGSTLAELTAAYPTLQQTTQVSLDGYGYAVGDDDAGWLDFIVYQDAVTYIGSSAVPRAPKEFCG